MVWVQGNKNVRRVRVDLIFHVTKVEVVEQRAFVQEHKTTWIAAELGDVRRQNEKRKRANYAATAKSLRAPGQPTLALLRQHVSCAQQVQVTTTRYPGNTFLLFTQRHPSSHTMPVTLTVIFHILVVVIFGWVDRIKGSFDGLATVKGLDLDFIRTEVRDLAKDKTLDEVRCPDFLSVIHDVKWNLRVGPKKKTQHTRLFHGACLNPRGT